MNGVETSPPPCDFGLNYLAGAISEFIKIPRLGNLILTGDSSSLACGAREEYSACPPRDSPRASIVGFINRVSKVWDSSREMDSAVPIPQKLYCCIFWLLVSCLLFLYLRLVFGVWKRKKMRGKKMDRVENREESDVGMGKGKRSAPAGREDYSDCPWGSDEESGCGDMPNVRIDGAIEAEGGEKSALVEVCEEEMRGKEELEEGMAEEEGRKQGGNGGGEADGGKLQGTEAVEEDERACEEAGYERRCENKEKSKNENGDGGVGNEEDKEKYGNKREDKDKGDECERKEGREEGGGRDEGGSGEEAGDKEYGNGEGGGPEEGEVKGGNEMPGVGGNQGEPGDNVIKRKENPEEERSTLKPILCESIIGEEREEGGGVELPS
ncbi:hypothetical protein HOY82DRAFT_536340 [Tuber indicum]|nr:hypothetical protein HOY82DRAFT_536340 [Tuber indicum]